MGTKVTTPDITNVTNSSGIPVINSNFDLVADEFDKVLYRDGSLAATGDMDMDSNRILNLPTPISSSEPTPFGYVEGLLEAIYTAGKYYSTILDGIAGEEVGDIFVSDELGTLAIYRVTNIAPFYELVDTLPTSAQLALKANIASLAANGGAATIGTSTGDTVETRLASIREVYIYDPAIDTTGATDASPAINAALAGLSEGQLLVLEGTIRVNSAILFPNINNIGIYLDDCTVTATAPFTDAGLPAQPRLIVPYTSATGQSIIGKNKETSILDANNGVAHFIIHATTTKETLIKNVVCKRWQYGIYMASSATAALVRPLIENVDVITPSTGTVQYPVQITARSMGWSVEGGHIYDLYIEGREGAYGSGAFTADQLALQGVHDMALMNIISLYGGENGLAFSRCCRNIKGFNLTSKFADGHAITVGSSLCEIGVSNITGWAINDVLTAPTSGQSGTIDQIVDYGATKTPRYVVRLDGLSSNFFTLGETITNGVTAKTIETLLYNDDIELYGCDFTDNGIDSAGGGLAFSSVFGTRARNLKVVGVSGSITRAPQEHHAYMTNSTYDISGLSRAGTVSIKDFVATGAGNVDLSHKGPYKKAGAQYTTTGAVVATTEWRDSVVGNATNPSLGNYTVTLSQSLDNYTRAVAKVTPVSSLDAIITAVVTSATTVDIQTSTKLGVLAARSFNLEVFEPTGM